MNCLKQAAVLLLQVVWLCCASCVPDKPAGEKAIGGIKLVCVWTLEGADTHSVETGVKQAATLGFNAVCWNRAGLPEVCHRQGLKAFAIISPLDLRPGAQEQVLEPGEEKLPGFEKDKIPPDQYFQYGGEPVPGNREILDQNLTCPNDPSVVRYALEQAELRNEEGYDGIIWDFIGYRNYHSCECGSCREKLGEFQQAHPDLSVTDAKIEYYKGVLVGLYATLFRETKAGFPDLLVLNHVHPVYLPGLSYWKGIDVDLCSVTVSWFFKPHWPLEKVRSYTREVVSGPYLNQGVSGMPMIGFYADREYARDRKDPGRLEAEFGILKEEGAQHIIVCELGHILRDPEAAAVVRRQLAGK